MIGNRATQRQWARVKPAFRKNFIDSTSAAIFAQDIVRANLATFDGDFFKYYSHVVRLVELHCEPFLAAEVDLADDHGFTAAQRRQVALIASDCYRKDHDKITLKIFLNGLPKHMFEKVANKPELTKPSAIIEYLKKCNTVASRNTVVPPPQQPQQPPATANVLEQINANSTYNTSIPNRTSSRGPTNNQQGRNNNNSSQNNSRKKTFCICCRKPNHEQEK